MKGFILVVLAVIAILFTSAFASRTKQTIDLVKGNIMAGRRAEAVVGTVIDGNYPWIENYHPATHVSLKFIDDIVHFCWINIIPSTEAREQQNYAEIKPVLDEFVGRTKNIEKKIYGAKQLPNGKNLDVGDLVATRVEKKTKSGQKNIIEKLAIVVAVNGADVSVVEAATVADARKKKTIVRKLPLDQFIAGIPTESVQYIRPDYWTRV